MGVLPALALAWTGSRILKSWGHSPCWALIFLAHPTVVILARTAMSDLLLSALALGAWWSLRNRRVVPGDLAAGRDHGRAPTGIPIAAAIIARLGDLLEKSCRSPQAFMAALKDAKVGIRRLHAWPDSGPDLERPRDRNRLVRLQLSARIPSFRLEYLRTSAPAHLRALLVNPPLLLLGLVPSVAAQALGTAARHRVDGHADVLLCLGRAGAATWLETVVLSERLILPIVAFLLVGYAAGLSSIAARLHVTGVAKVILVIAPAVVAFKIGSRHLLWQEPMRSAREAATTLARQVGSERAWTDLRSPRKRGCCSPARRVGSLRTVHGPPSCSAERTATPIGGSLRGFKRTIDATR